MKVRNVEYSEDAIKVMGEVEKVFNFMLRNYDRAMGAIGLGGRAADYDDYKYEFLGGENEELRRKHYDKSLRLLWKAEKHAGWTSFKDCTKEEKALMSMADEAMNDIEKKEVTRLKSEEYRKFLNEQYTPEQKQAIVNILSLIGHGEAYAWLVSTELLRDVESTGGKAAVTMQVLEEAKHFVVLRELVQAFDVEVPRMPVYEYFILEQTLKSKGLEKFFGMNVVVEGIAFSIFGALSKYPGLEILKMFHLDESRHTGLPTNYFKTKPMTWWDKSNPAAMAKRFALILPAIPMAMKFEKDFAVLGIDSLEFAGSVVRKIVHLAYRVGFYLPMPQESLKQLINYFFNVYRHATRPGHTEVDYLSAETTQGEEELAVEREIFQLVG